MDGTESFCLPEDMQALDVPDPDDDPDDDDDDDNDDDD